MPKRKKKIPKSKRDHLNARTHFKYRAAQRYDVSINHETYRKIIRTVQNNGQIQPDGTYAEYMGKINKHRTLWLVHVSDEVIVTIYDNCIHDLITSLPKNCYEAVEFGFLEKLAKRI